MMNREELSAYVLDQITKETPNMALMAGTGVGKTKIALDIVDKFKCKKILVLIAERAHKKNWEEEMIRWYPKLKGVEFFCYASMHKLEDKYDMVIFDECHHLGTDKRLSYLQNLHPKFRVFLSATLSSQFLSTLEYLLRIRITRVKYSLQDAIDSKVLKEPKIYLIPLELDNKVADDEIVESWGKEKLRVKLQCTYREIYSCTSTVFKRRNPNVELHIKCTQAQHYEYLTKKMDYYKRVFESYRSEIMKNKWLQYGSKRKRLLGELKTEEVKRLLNYLDSKRFICFCTSINQANELGGTNAIHSKSGNKALEDFNSLKSDKLFAVGMLQEGMNLKKIEVGIIVQLDGQELRFIQKSGRVYRAENPVQYIFYYKNTRDEEYLTKALEGINPEYIKEFNYEDNN